MSVARIETLKEAARLERDKAQKCREALQTLEVHAPTVALYARRALSDKAEEASRRAARLEADARVGAVYSAARVLDRPSPQERIRHAESRLGALDRSGRETRCRVSKTEERLEKVEDRITALEKRGETTVKPDPDTVTDGDGDLWTRAANGRYFLDRAANGRYFLDRAAAGEYRTGYRTLDQIRASYGLR